MKRILILCTGNSCRSQMAEAFLRSFDPSLHVSSAGTSPAREIHPKAIVAMKEVGIDLSGACPKHVDQFLGEAFDFAVTVCDDARETCPVFAGHVEHRRHIGFDDPAAATGSEADIMNTFRRVRDEIQALFFQFYTEQVRPTIVP